MSATLVQAFCSGSSAVMVHMCVYIYIYMCLSIYLSIYLSKSVYVWGSYHNTEALILLYYCITVLLLYTET